MNEEEKIDQMRRYWLGFLTEQESCAFEASWFDNDEDSELVAAVRDDLIQDYLAGELNDDELKGFTVNLLGQLNLVEDVAFAGAINRVLAGQEGGTEADTNRLATKIGWFDQLTAGFRQILSGGVPAAAFGALVIVILIGGIVFRSSFTNKSPDTALVQPPDDGQIAPVATVEAGNQPDPPQIVQTENPNSQPAKKPPPPTKNVQPKTLDQNNRQNSYVALILGATVRGPEAMPKKVIPPEVANLRLIFPKPNFQGPYIKYSAKIIAVDNGRIIGRSSLPDLSKKKTGQDVPVTFPKQGLVPGEYKLVVVGKRSNAEPDVLLERKFRILEPLPTVISP